VSLKVSTRTFGGISGDVSRKWSEIYFRLDYLLSSTAFMRV